MLELTPDELLTTTRTVRKRLDLERPVERALLEECLAVAQQAPTGGNRQSWGFVVVTDPVKRAALGEIYARSWEIYATQGVSPRRAPGVPMRDAAARERQRRIGASAKYLADNMGRVPVLIVPCIQGRTDGEPNVVQASIYGSVLPAVWNLMLAARARGLGTAWTTIHLFHEREAAEVLGIPFDDVMQVALVPLAHTIGTDFKAGAREPLDTFVHWEAW